MSPWSAFPYQHATFQYDAQTLKSLWPRLHAGDAEPWPRKPALVEAWRLFHAGAFQAAHVAGLNEAEAGNYAGLSTANKAQAIYAHYLEPKEKVKQQMFLEVAERAVRHQTLDPDNPNAYFWQAYAIGRYAQGHSVITSLSQGLGHKFMKALEMAIELAPRHADAHMALGAYHAELIHKFGRLLARARGADVATGLAMYERALALNPQSPIAMMERANGLVMLEGEKRQEEADGLYIDAASSEPRDAMEWLAAEQAKDELDD